MKSELLFKVPTICREQKLIDACFELVLVATDPKNIWFKKKTNEQKAEWVTRELKALGFSTSPCGLSWGVLDR